MTFSYCELCTSYRQFSIDGCVSCALRDTILFNNRPCPYYNFLKHIRGIDI